MTLFGLAGILTEFVPQIQIGPVELDVSSLWFVPVLMVCLFHPLYGALGAPLGEAVFEDLLMGDFSGLGQIEGYLTIFIGLYIAGSLVRDPRNRWAVATAAVLAAVLDQGIASLIDLAKVWVGVEDAEYVDGLPESMLAVEGLAFAVDVTVAGILLGAIPAAYLAPRLHGKIEPLMGMAPRDPEHPLPGRARKNAAFAALAVFLVLVAGLSSFIEAADVKFGVWEAEFVDEYGEGFLLIGAGASLLVLIGVVIAARAAARRSRTDYESERR